MTVSPQVMYLWVGRSCSLEFLTQVLGVDSYASVPLDTVHCIIPLPDNAVHHCWTSSEIISLNLINNYLLVILVFDVNKCIYFVLQCLF